MNTETERYQRAKSQVQEQKDFWVHLAVFVPVNAGLVALNLVKEPEKLWVHWVLMGWGAGILLHAFKAFGGGAAKDWEERKINEIVKQGDEKESNRPKSSAS